MTKLFNRLVFAGAIFLAAFALTACGGGGGSSSGISDSGGGTTFLLTDAPPGTNTYQAVYVTINEVQVNLTEDEEDGWKALTDLDLPLQVDLLSLTNGARVQLGIADLEPGHYNQMRLILSVEEDANYVIDGVGNQIFLKVPSGGKTGVKLGNGFDITGDSTDIVLLDFDVNKSLHVHPAGKSGKWVLRPTVRVVAIENSVEGAVDAGARVSAQVNDPDAGNVKDEVVEVASANEENGEYFMNLPINTTGIPYNLVATKEGFEPECQSLGSTASAEYTGFDFTFGTEATMGTMNVTIRNQPVPLIEDTFFVYLSIRQIIECDGTPSNVEVYSNNNSENTTGDPIPFGSIALPEGDYEIVVWADDPEVTDGVIILDPISDSVPPSLDPMVIDFNPVCGDGVLVVGEQCDDGGESATCNADCTISTCGDGTLNVTAGEQCDDAGESATCNADCTSSICGDGTLNVTAGEQCDDGGESATCNADCTSSICGDGTLNTTAGEQCDDNNNTDGDGCQADCTLP